MCSIVYEQDVLEAPPAHLDVAFFTEVLETALRTARIKLLGIQLSMGSSSGENYCSKIYRVRMSYTENKDSQKNIKQLALIVKSIPRVDSIEFIEDLQVYLKEKVVYYEVLPRLELLMQCKRRFGPKLYECLKQPESTLVFEDLGQLGYIMASREQGLDEAHCHLVMERLAEFHAASMVLAKLDPHLIEAFGDGMLSPQGLARDDGLILRFFSGNGQQLHTLVSGWAGFERIAQKIKKHMDEHRKQLIRAQAPLDNEIKVLNHGDLWVNNILFKYNAAQQLQDAIFIDFQLSVWGSPGIDLNYFFYTSLSLDVLKHKRPALLKTYHNRLTETLFNLDMGVAVPTYEQVLKDVQRRESYGFFASYAIFPLVSQDKSQTGDNDLKNFSDAEFAKKKSEQQFASPRLAETLRYTLPHFERAGVLD
ncbi:CG9497, partial [Drosophila busckii]